MGKNKNSNKESEDVKSVKSLSDTLTNTGINNRRINGVDIPAGGTYTLTKIDKEDLGLMDKINYAIKLGVLARD